MAQSESLRDPHGRPLRSLREDPRLPELTGLDRAAIDAELGRLCRCGARCMGALEEWYLRAQLYLRKEDGDLCLSLIVSTVVTAVQRSKGGASEAELADLLAEREDRVRKFTDWAGERWARKRYTHGLVEGIAASLLLLPLLAAALLFLIWTYHAGIGHRRWPPSLGEVIAVRDGVACILGGAAGAVISVLLRMSRTRWVDYPFVDERTAWYRIMTGWFFAAGALLLMKAKIVQLFSDPSERLLATNHPRVGDWALSWFFWSAVGLLAGFNEAWTKNLFTRNAPASDDHKEDGGGSQSEESAKPRQP
jgi:hypothetical protein